MGVGRRSFVVGAVGAVGVLLNGCSAGPAPNPRGLEDSRKGASIADASSIPKGGGVVVSDAGIVVARDGEGRLHGFSAVCTHAGCLVGEVTDGLIVCPCHGSRFDASTGAPVAGPAKAPLVRVPVGELEGKVVIG
ncbi:Rieske (2Fe-2S) protein [Streptomyces sp. SKN60]|uniref:Rieske (2Fe-2S) protein n=1 Tax=Streptomyces sp. SKN60 TaxID=2855506 RepID=UPI0027E3E6A6|nr:Rieske (2Fe-2S) protein [Streptomyces sp. SKN60]MCX2185037.1 Rieske (2Fe-2S) protein [Streptomyces sp. SKN60]